MFEKGNLVCTFKDEINFNEKYDFIRNIDNYKYYIKDNSIVLTTKELPTKFLKSLEREFKLNKDKIITFDIETLLIEQVHKPYLFSIYDGDKSYSWFTDSLQLFNHLLRRKYKGASICP